MNNLTIEQKANFVLSGIKGEQDIDTICEAAGITRARYDDWVETFIAGGKQQLELREVENSSVILNDQSFLRDLVERFPGNILISRFNTGEILFTSADLAPQLDVLRHALNRWADQDARTGFLKELKEHGHAQNVPIVATQHDGTELILHFSSRLLEHNGESIIVSCQVRSPDGETSYQELENANAQFHEALEAFDEGFVLWDSDFKLVLENERMFKMLYPDVLPPRIAQPGDDFKLVLTEQFENGVYKKPFGVPAKLMIAGFERLIRNYAKNVNVELKDGRTIRGSSHRTSHGGYLLTFSEVTEQRRAQRAEKEAGELLREAIEALDDGVMLYDSEMRLELFNQKANEIFYDGKGVFELGQTFYGLCEYFAISGILVMPEGLTKEEWASFAEQDVRNHAQNSELTTVEGRTILASSYRTNLGGYLLTFKDVTEQRTTQQELEKERHRTHQSEKLSALGELLAGVAHELNNPLSIVVGYSLMLQEHIEDPVQAKRIERISQAAERCAKIVKMFLAMARQNPLNIESHSVNDVLRMVIDTTLADIDTEKIQLETSLDPNLPDVDIDADQMAQVFTNLIMNACQAFPDDERNCVIKLSSQYDRRSNEVIVSVADNGIGISREVQKRIFEPLFTTKEAGRGTGVGLALSHRIVSSHHGELLVDSDVGKGATFHVRLTAADKSHQNIDEPAERNDQSVPLKICVIDDEEDVAVMIEELLEQIGHSVEVYSSPKKVLEQKSATKFDIILCDMKMPEMDGQEFYEVYTKRNLSKNAKIAFITGDTMSANVSKFFKTNALPYLEKPIIPDDLEKLIGRLAK
ncbi:MAG: PAS-domain containing protein [Hyphomicrobiales bacterium]